jgi:hypothetical protein
MSRTVRFSLGLWLSLLVGQAVAQAPAIPPATSWIPQDAVICLEISRPKALLDLLAGEKMTAKVTSLPLYQKLTANPGFMGVTNLIRFLEVSLDTDWRTGLGKLTGGGITLAVCPKDTVLLIVDAEDQRLLERTHDFLRTMVQSDTQTKGLPNPVVSAEYLGVTGWSFNGKESHAIIGKRLILSNNPEGLKGVLDLRNQTAGQSFATVSDYAAAKKTIEQNSVASAFVNLGLLKGIPDIDKALSQGKSNPLAALFFSGMIEAIRNSQWLSAGLYIQDQTLDLRAAVDGKPVDPAGPAGFALPQQPGEGALPNLVVPRQIASLSFYRDLHRFYAAKDDLFPERTSQLIFFENMMGIFFSGRNLTDEVLIETRPHMRFVVAEQEYDPAIGTPQVRIPAFAMILQLRDQEQFDEVVEEAWQKAVGLINFTRGQQAMPGLIIDRPIHNGSKFTVAYFSTAGLKEKTNLNTRFNFRPSLAMPGDYLVLSSSDGLARNLIDAQKKEAAQSVKPLAGKHTLAELDGGQLSSILQSNYDNLVRKNMIDKGNTQQDAEASIDLFVALTKLVKHLGLSVGTQDRLTEAQLKVELNLP